MAKTKDRYKEIQERIKAEKEAETEVAVVTTEGPRRFVYDIIKEDEKHYAVVELSYTSLASTSASFAVVEGGIYSLAKAISVKEGYAVKETTRRWREGLE